MAQLPLRYGDKHPLGAAYPVEQPAFAGPLDLLLSLIERQQLDISEISLVAVTDSYLATIDQMANLAPAALADFLTVASRLIYIKSRALLPKPQPPLEEGEDEDAGDALVRQLLEYRQFKQIAEALRTREEAGLRVYPRTTPALDSTTLERRLDLSNVDLARLQKALQRVLRRMPSEPPLPRVRTYTVTVAEQIEHVRQLVRARLSASNGERRNGNAQPVIFTELLSEQPSRIDVVVTFLAVLELIKQREIEARQAGVFGEIVLVVAQTTVGQRAA